ncbi:MAG: Rad52/Rad22 family DNA repair protein [bacterium]|nr:Rad52/Rad22 family DNA repair protein [bacterium]
MTVQEPQEERSKLNRQLLEKPFDPSQIKQREGSFGDVLDYIEGPTVIQRLNEAFDGEWSFEVVEYKVIDEEVLVIGKLSANGIVKTQFGKSKITRHKESKKVISLGDDCKAASTDCLKKCATLFGVGLHLYLEETGKPPASPQQDGKPAKPGEDGASGRLTARQLSAIYALGKNMGKSNQGIKKYTLEVFNKVPDFLTREEASTIIKMLQEDQTNG